MNRMPPVADLQPAALVPGEVRLGDDGVPFSDRFGDVYFSAAGGLGETRHTFLLGNGLPERWAHAERFTIVETGFGTGLNFLATWQAWRALAPAGTRLYYLAVEKHPLSREDLWRTSAMWPELVPLGRELARVYPPPVPGYHRVHLDDDRVMLTLLFGDATALLTQLHTAVDAFYLDGFAPSKNPDMWTNQLFRELARLATPAATLATYTVAGEVKRGLTDAGFRVEKRAGFGRKREMLVGMRADVAQQAVPASPAFRNAAVIGAGLAGTACAERLAARGWSVDLVERHVGPACEASANPMGIFHPALLVDRRTRSTLTSVATLYAIRQLEALDRSSIAPRWMPTGVLQVCRDPRRLERLAHAWETVRLPASVVRRVDRDEGSMLVGIRAGGDGFWFATGGWAKGASICEARLAACNNAVRLRFHREVAKLERTTHGWRVLSASGDVLSEAAVVVLANARKATAIEGVSGLSLQPVRGQVTLMPEAAGRVLRAPVCGDGYVTPAVDGSYCIGATFDENETDCNVRREDHAVNVDRLHRMLPGFGGACDPSHLDGWVGIRAMSPDRLPLAGPLSRDGEPGLFACLALGARGLTWSALLGELVASYVNGDPLPLERRVVQQLAPGRAMRDVRLS